MSELYALTGFQQDAVLEAIELVRQHGCRQSVAMPDGGEAYAYPCARGVAWGFNAAATGHCVARGVVEG